VNYSLRLLSCIFLVASLHSSFASLYIHPTTFSSLFHVSATMYSVVVVYTITLSMTLHLCQNFKSDHYHFPTRS
jgi:hypothetical protein